MKQMDIGKRLNKEAALRRRWRVAAEIVIDNELHQSHEWNGHSMISFGESIKRCLHSDAPDAWVENPPYDLHTRPKAVSAEQSQAWEDWGTWAKAAVVWGRLCRGVECAKQSQLAQWMGRRWALASLQGSRQTNPIGRDRCG
jgi:hypothetical protein